MADQYLDAMGDRVRTGAFATLAWHLGMLGRGSETGPQHVAVLREKGGGEGAEGITWGLKRLVSVCLDPLHTGGPSPGGDVFADCLSGLGGCEPGAFGFDGAVVVVDVAGPWG